MPPATQEAATSSATAPLPTRLWASVLVVTLSSLLIGWAVEQLNALTGDPTQPGALVLNTFEISLATTMLYVTSLPAALLTKTPMERWGRRAVLLGADVFFIAGGALTASDARHPPLLIYFGRGLIGVGVGTSLTVVPTLLSETIAPPSHPRPHRLRAPS